MEMEMNIEPINQIVLGMTAFMVFCSVLVTIHDPDGAPPMAKAIAFVSIGAAMLGCIVLGAVLIVELLTGRSVFPSLGV